MASAPLNANDLQRIFQRLDRNADGLVSLEELNWVLEKIGVHFTLEELQTLVEKPSLDFNEFLFFCNSIISNQKNSASASASAAENSEETINEEDEVEDEDSDLYKAFTVFDQNGDGFITSEELQNVLAKLGMWDENSGNDCRSMIHVYDTNSDGVLDFEEFKSMMFRTTIS
ncbi:Calcium-binding protein [Melia azedarach]|uniref:Calcium-binding protein n=1 Tax=Melia azedarach TaxID=155640 RepID=A0ACC1WR18_MELAZ|nr:Calcium-binding protein [Melia azedarach]